jgi:exopolyphosphatase / guanosine-5'-triphosphate,3'-diphosphate pyrophosphatase
VRAACIDIGSNTTRLLVAELVEGQLVDVHQERAFTRLGRELAGSGSGSISETKLEEVIEVVRGQLARARDRQATEIHGVATAAVRDAANGWQFVDAIREATGLTVQILAEEDEARLAFEGAAATLDFEPSGDLAVVDVGGGSSELVVGGAPDQIRWWRSLPLGSSTLADGWAGSDPPSTEQLGAARAEVASALEDCRPPRPALAIAVGGSATSLARLAGPVLDVSTLRRVLSVLTARPAIEISRQFEIDPQRATLLPAGLVILEGVGRLLQTILRVGRGGIREGVLLEALRR